MADIIENVNFIDDGWREIPMPNGKEGVLAKINVFDLNIDKKFFSLYDEVKRSFSTCEKDLKAYEVIHHTKDRTLSTQEIMEFTDIRRKNMNTIISELEKFYGGGMVERFYGVDITPDEDAMAMFVNYLFSKTGEHINVRVESFKSKYNSGRRGAQA